MSKHLNQWVETQLKEYGWNLSELARRADLSNSFISHVLSGRTNPGAKFYMGMGKAFNLKPSIIEKIDKEGVLPDENEDISDMGFSEWKSVLGKLTPDERYELMKIAFQYVLKRDADPPAK